MIKFNADPSQNAKHPEILFQLYPWSHAKTSFYYVVGHTLKCQNSVRSYCSFRRATQIRSSFDR